MPYRIGLLAYPLFIFLTARQRNSAASKFLAAGAVSPETARRPESLAIPRNLGLINDGVRTGVLVPIGDGRFYVNVPAYRKRRAVVLAVFIGGSVVLAAALAFLLMPKG